MLPTTFKTFLVSLLSLYIVVNPPAVASVYIGLTAGFDPSERRGIVRRATLTAAAILTMFSLAGTFILSRLQVTAAALQIAGGIFIFALAFALARGKEREFFGMPAEAAGGASLRSLAYSPLAVPMMAGPAPLTLVMTLSTKAGDDPYAWAALLAAILLTLAICALSMQRWIRLAHVRGPAFGAVLTRVMGLVLAVIAVQFLIDGLEDVIVRLMTSARAAVPPSP